MPSDTPEVDEELRTLGIQIDAASDVGDADKLKQLDDQCGVLVETSAGSKLATLWYYRSNVHATLQNLDDPKSWNWRQPHRERQILYLRRTRSHPEFMRLCPLVRAQVTTNLANNLSNLGRSLEAITLYDDALRQQPQFAMALGNRGLARDRFARALHDRGQAHLILLAAHGDLQMAVSSSAV
jgi:tetratricopeptide (TPR) repeat protein